ncbi:histidine kinase [[Bacillus] enclensis]|uniref:Signal transduction histidine-protein kinase/phosphatase DegS n=1 Tax=[Bacillus] enclensis TaxID=1402860 RepID=A0A0V8HDI9_9BACI|nr:sensor histidine kinase [[Bacillus] enclensis]KSU60424.1 histidine kinase [[Bacillus] enclensis]SCC24342.1 two-component system, NarL family, sensor histidine kinase DegS [[Bacillus] enclensis]
MSLKKINTKMLDLILEKMVETVDHSKDEIFQIGEQCRNDFEDLNNELLEVKEMVVKVIDEGDDLTRKSRLARLRLSEVSKHFQTYSEDQVREAYEAAHDLQMKLSMNRQLEKQLRDRRDELQRRLQSLGDTIDRAEHLCTQISVVLNYLNSDLRQVNEALEDAKQRQDFGLQIIEAQEEERKRLSREIHDGPAQMMANVLMRSDLIDRVYREKGSEEAIKEIRDLKKMVRSALYEVRRIIYDLRPMALDDLGLIPTLRKYLSTIEEYNHKTSIQFVNIGLDIRLPSKYEVALFRLVQECVQNALKHAESTHIQVKVEVKKDKITVVVKDNGKGFDIETQKTGSFGIMGMKERVDLLEGDITIDSKLGAGTVVLIQVPLNK